MTTLQTLYKTTTFSAIKSGEQFTADLQYGDRAYLKTTPTKARLFCAVADSDSLVEFTVKRSAIITVEHVEAMARREAFLAKPLYDGTEASCASRQHYYALESAHREVVRATEQLDTMADYVAQKMADIKRILRRTATEAPQVDRFSPRFTMTPVDATKSCILNSCGELQGNGNVDMLVAALLVKREAYAALVYALGYRLTETEGAR